AAPARAPGCTRTLGLEPPRLDHGFTIARAEGGKSGSIDPAGWSGWASSRRRRSRSDRARRGGRGHPPPGVPRLSRLDGGRLRALGSTTVPPPPPKTGVEVGSSSPTFRASNGSFTVTVENAELALPTLEGSLSGAFVE